MERIIVNLFIVRSCLVEAIIGIAAVILPFPLSHVADGGVFYRWPRETPQEHL